MSTVDAETWKIFLGPWCAAMLGSMYLSAIALWSEPEEDDDEDDEDEDELEVPLEPGRFPWLFVGSSAASGLSTGTMPSGDISRG